MIGLANGNNYSEQLTEQLQPLLDTTSHIMHATGLQENLTPNGNYFRQPQAILNTLKSGVLSIDCTGKIRSANQSAAMIFGYVCNDLIGLKIQSLIPPAGNDEFYDSDNNLDLRPNLLGRSFEASGVSKTESHFPVGVSIDRIDTSEPTQFALVVRNITEDKKRERFRNEFISMVSHELRTPLTAVHISLSMLDSPEFNPMDVAEVDHMISIASRNCERLVQLVDEILDYEKLNLNEIEFKFRPVSLDEIIAMVEETTRLLADSAQIQLTFIKPEQPFNVAADVLRLSQVLVNLIANATVSYTHLTLPTKA